MKTVEVEPFCCNLGEFIYSFNKDLNRSSLELRVKDFFIGLLLLDGLDLQWVVDRVWMSYSYARLLDSGF